MTHYVIPARQGSKGLPNKNRYFLSYTLAQLDFEQLKSTIITSDDSEILERCHGLKIKSLKRVAHLASDTASMKSVLLNLDLPPEDTICLLYLTYPQRKHNEIIEFLDFFEASKARSMLCKKQVKTHPYLCLYAENNRQVVNHNLYRRQDYPEVFEISHYMGAFKVSELPNLNFNLYNNKTIFYPIRDVINIDTVTDMEKFRGKL